MKKWTRFGSIDERSVGKSTLAPTGLLRLRNGIHLRLGGIVLVRGGSGAAADAIRWRRLPLPGLPAEDGGGNLDAAEDVEIPLVLRRDCNRSAIPLAQFVT